MAAPFSLGDYAYAHRGLWAVGGPPENSMPAFMAAAEAGLGLEFDVRLSQDGIPVCFHDATLDRMTDHKGALADKTAAELTKIELAGGPVTLPTLEDLLSSWPHDLPLLVEMKAMDIPPVPIARAVARQLLGYHGRAAIMSFNTDAMRALPLELPRGLLIEKIHKSSLEAFKAGLHTALELKVDYVSVWRDDVAEAAPFAQDHGLGVVTWTIQTPEQSSHVAPYVDAQIFEGFAPSSLIKTS